MAYPSIGSYSSGSNNSNATSHSITMPSGISAGDFLLVFFVSDGVCTHSVNTSSSGNSWVNYSTNYIGTDETGITTTVFYKVAESSNTLIINTSESQYSSNFVYRIEAGSYDTTLQSATTGINSANPNLPSCGSIYSSEALWIATVVHNSTITASVAPTDFTNLLTQAGTGTESCSISTARRNYTGISLDPDSFTASSGYWVGWIIKISAPGYIGIGINYSFKTVSIS